MRMRRRVQRYAWDGTAKTEIFDLPNDALLDSIELRLSFTDTLSAGAVAGTVLDTAVARCLRSLKLIADGRLFMKNYSARSAWNIAAIYGGTDPEHVPPADGAVGAKAVAVTVPIELSSRRGHPAALTRLDSRRFKKLQLEVEFAAPAAMYSADNDMTHVVSLAVLEIFYEQIAGPNARGGAMILQEQEIPLTYSAAAVNHLEDITIGKAYRRFVLLTEDDGTADDPPVNTFVTNLDLVANNIIHIYAGNFLDLRAVTKAKFQREALQTGWAVIDVLQGGSLRTCLDAASLNTLQLELDAAANTKLYLVTAALIPYGR